MAIKVPWIGTSWKMNKIRADARSFARVVAADPLSTTDAACLFVIPPFTAIAETATIFEGTSVAVGAQTMHWADRGPWTGEVSPLMILDCGATLVEIGHSDRRMYCGETDETVALKTAAAVRHGLIAFVCVGDGPADMEAGRSSDALRAQVEAALSQTERDAVGQVVIVYEPAWASDSQATPADPAFIDRQHAVIKEITNRAVGTPLDVVYGGLVTSSNCVAFAGRQNIDGLLIGRPAWTAEGYLGIVDSVIAGLRS